MENNFTKKLLKLRAICFFPEIYLINSLTLLPFFPKVGRPWRWDVVEVGG